ncbi:hypothetical protein DFH28DRAFT_1131089 [Melampsora americana]|nr:hypothetical protein DFH28DRAFT_1199846 [Melampsora americana]KAH9811475.1 hypothetical protein DFH28DRAFT_1131089 [Melampsora americana]
METLDGPTRKQLEKASNGLLSSTSTSKPSSVPVQTVSVRSMIKSTRSMRTASGPASVTQDERTTSYPGLLGLSRPISAYLDILHILDFQLLHGSAAMSRCPSADNHLSKAGKDSQNQ